MASSLPTGPMHRSIEARWRRRGSWAKMQRRWWTKRPEAPAICGLLVTGEIPRSPQPVLYKWVKPNKLMQLFTYTSYCFQFRSTSSTTEPSRARSQSRSPMTNKTKERQRVLCVLLLSLSLPLSKSLFVSWVPHKWPRGQWACPIERIDLPDCAGRLLDS